MEHGLLEFVKSWINRLSHGVEICAAIIIGLAALEAFARALLIFVRRDGSAESKAAVRLNLGRWLAVGLEFELAADILRTSVAPTWNDIGQLAAIAVLRTALNYFLDREIREEGPGRQV